MTEERMGVIGSAIATIVDTDDDKARKLFSLTAEGASEMLKDEGFSITADELKELGAAIRIALAQAERDELSADMLDEAAGGYGPPVYSMAAKIVMIGGRGGFAIAGSPVIPLRYITPVQRQTTIRLVW